MAKFVNESMSTAEQVDYAWTHRALFERCRDHNDKVRMLRLRGTGGRHVSGWASDAETLLAEHAL